MQKGAKKMEKISVIYWSQSGNTKEMAEAIGRGIVKTGKTAEVVDVSRVSIEELKLQNVFALGCPAMGSEVLEEVEMEPFVSEVEQFAAGKSIALFGSYSWGDGEWMREWVDRMSNAGATVVNQEGTICQDTPDASALSQCEQLGEQISMLL